MVERLFKTWASRRPHRSPPGQGARCLWPACAGRTQAYHLACTRVRRRRAPPHGHGPSDATPRPSPKKAPQKTDATARLRPASHTRRVRPSPIHAPGRRTKPPSGSTTAGRARPGAGAQRHTKEGEGNGEGWDLDRPRRAGTYLNCSVTFTRAGPRITTKMAGKMKNMRGKSNLTVVLAARSSASFRLF